MPLWLQWHFVTTNESVDVYTFVRPPITRTVPARSPGRNDSTLCTNKLLERSAHSILCFTFRLFGQLPYACKQLYFPYEFIILFPQIAQINVWFNAVSCHLTCRQIYIPDSNYLNCFHWGSPLLPYLSNISIIFAHKLAYFKLNAAVRVVEQFSPFAHDFLRLAQSRG